MRKKMLAAVTGAIFMCCSGIWSDAFAQNLTGEITGAVTDPSGAVISGATITLTSVEKNVVVRTTKSNASGEYSIPLLLIGAYSITADAQGFHRKKVENIDLHVNATLSIPISLTPGSVTQSVTVTASSLAPNVVSATASSLINGTQMKELSLNTRNFEQLLALQPGIAGNAAGQYRGIIRPTGQTTQSQFSVNGNRLQFNGYFLDGADILNHGGSAQVGVFTSIDAIQEQSIVRNAYDASYGGSGAGIVTIQTKSGTSQFHGGAYYFFRSQVLNANDYFSNLTGVPRPPVRYADFGYTIGGPVWLPRIISKASPKLFLFVSQEFLRDRDSTTETLTNIPTAAQRAGTFTSPICVYSATGTCMLSTQVTNLDSTAQAYLKDLFSKVPLPNSPTDPQGLHVTQKGIENETQTLIRGDYQISDKWNAFIRYLNDPYDLMVPNGLYQATGVPNVGNSHVTNGGTNLLVHSTYTLGSNTVIEGGYAWYPIFITAQVLGALNPANSPDVHPALPYTPTLAQIPHLNISGRTYLTTGPYYDYPTTQQAFVNVTRTMGRHTLYLGWNFARYSESNSQGSLNAGLFTFNATAPKGSTATAFMQSWANFLQGLSSSFTQNSIDAVSHAVSTLHEGYIQDNFKVTLRLSLTGGVRYSLIGVPTNPKGLLDSFDPGAFNSAAAPTVDSNGLICTKSPCAGGSTPNANYSALNGIIGKPTGVTPFGSKVTTQPNLNWAPRLGFAYDLFGNGRTSLRGGYGIYYARLANYIQNPNFNNPPLVSNISITNASLDDPARGVATSNVPLTVFGFQPGWKTPYSQTWSLDVQEQIASKTLLDVGYYGNVVRHLNVAVDLNQPQAGAYVAAGIAAPGGITAGAPTQELNRIRPYPGYGAINFTSMGAVSSYNSVQTSITQRFHGNSLVNVNYTYSRALDDANSPQNAYNLAAEYSPSNLGRTHILTADFVYDLPFFEQQRGLVGYLLGGWEFSGIVSVNSGQFLTATTSALDPAGQGLLATGSVGQHRPDQLSNPNSGGLHTRVQWFNTNAFVPVPTSQTRPGNASPGSIIGPGSQQWDLSLFRNAKITERLTLQLRAESFNTFNRVNWSGIDSNLEDSNYGQVTGDSGPRNLQLGAKLTF